MKTRKLGIIGAVLAAALAAPLLVQQRAEIRDRGEGSPAISCTPREAVMSQNATDIPT